MATSADLGQAGGATHAWAARTGSTKKAIFCTMIDHEQTLSDRVSHALRRDPYLSRRNLRFESLAGKVKISGVVQSYYQKQMAQEVVRRIDGVERVENDLEVIAV